MDLPMSSKEPFIRVNQLSKCYQVYRRPQDRLKQALVPRMQRLIMLKPRQFYREFWALRGVSFEIHRGETVGIVGRNGSGKSTLLQLICGTLNPTAGHCETHGTVAALLELGTGFNPQFSGLENVYLYGQILGMSRSHIERILPDILTFADIGKFIHQPVKTYSSGMMVRLAFAVSVAREPDILVVDEALAVGDEAFRRKCFARIEALREKGTTILFVSHAAALVVELCDRALLLDGGELLFDGPPKETIALYNKLLFAPEVRRAQVRQEIRKAAESPIPSTSTSTSPSASPQIVNKSASKTDRPHYIEGLIPQSRTEFEQLGALIIDPHIETLEGQRVNCLIAMQEYQYRYDVRFLEHARNVQFGMLIKTISGVQIGGACHPTVNTYLPEVKGGQTYHVSFNFRALMNPGTYFFNAGVQAETAAHPERTYLHRILDAVMFRVQAYEGRMTNALINFDIASMAASTEEH
jgi:lipopolysaccharide transport system ATP-binding protein